LVSNFTLVSVLRLLVDWILCIFGEVFDAERTILLDEPFEAMDPPANPLTLLAKKEYVVGDSPL